MIKLARAVFVEGRPQRAHHLFVALGSWTLGIGSVVGNSLVEKILGLSRNWLHVGDA